MNKFHTPKKHKVITLFSNKAISTTSVSNTLSNVFTISASGSGYGVVPPNVVFSGGSGSGASAVASMVNGGVSSITLTNGGVYTSAPTIAFTANNTASATVLTTSEGSLGIPTVVSGGTGYITPVVVISAPDIAGGTQAVGSVTNTAGVLSAFTLSTKGTGYAGDPIISIQDIPTGSGAVINIITFNNEITSATLLAGGTGYNNTGVDVIITSSSIGNNGLITATVSGGVITGISLVNKGTGYDYTTKASVISKTGSGCVLTATVNEKVVAVNMITNGYYSAIPTGVVFSAPPAGGTTATGTVVSAPLIVGGITGTVMVQSVSITNTGSGYLVPPTISFTAGTTQAITTAAATCTISPSRTYEYCFDIPNMELTKNAKVSLIYLASNNTTSIVYTMRMKEINQHNSWNNDYG
jgi:hypothetical protein